MTGDRGTLRLVLPRLREIVARHRQGTRFGIGVDPADGLLRQGAEGLSAYLDGCQGRRLGGYPPPGQGGGDQCPLVQRPAAAGGLGCRGRRSDRRRRPMAEHGGTGAGGVQSSASGTPRAAISTMSSMAKQGRIRPAGRTRSLRFRCHMRCLHEERWEAGARNGARTPADPRRTAFIGGRASRLQAAVFRRSAQPGRRLSSGNGLGVADRSVHRRLAAASIPDEQAAAREFLNGFIPHLDDGCIGSISEVFDAEAPFHARGCIAQAWSVAEVLRSLIRTA